MGDVIQGKFASNTPLMSQLRQINIGLSQNKTAQQIREEEDSKKAEIVKMSLDKAISVTATHIGWKATEEFLRKYIGERT